MTALFSTRKEYFLKEMELSFLIQISQHEADLIIKTVKNTKLVRSSAGKKHGGKTYYVLNDDLDALRILARDRNYHPIFRFCILESGYRKKIQISPETQLLENN